MNDFVTNGPREQGRPASGPIALQIGTVRLENNLIMAPMAGITDLPFRVLAREGGAGLVCTEMVSANALSHGDGKTLRMLELAGNEHPASAQIFGAVPSMMAEAAAIAQDRGADIVDINFGCPVPKIVKSGAGVKLIENEERMAHIMEAVAGRVKIPVTVKIRIGIRREENVAPRLVRLAAQSGVKAITVHGRPAVAGHTGAPDMEALAAAVAEAPIPVIANGGITDELTAARMLQMTGCAGLMIGRAAIGDFGLFKRIVHYLERGTLMPSPSWEERLEMLKRHAERSSAYYGEQLGIVLLRKVAPYYLKGLPNAARIRERFNRITALRELDELFALVWESPHFDQGS